MRGVPLAVCHVGRMLPQGQQPGADAPMLAETPGPDIVSECIRLAGEIAPGVTINGCRRQGSPPDGLLQVAEECELLVLGVRGVCQHGSSRTGAG